MSRVRVSKNVPGAAYGEILLGRVDLLFPLQQERTAETVSNKRHISWRRIEFFSAHCVGSSKRRP
jgi:hypothetical protein